MVASINVVTSVKEQLHTVFIRIIGEVYIVVLAPVVEDYGLPRIIVLVNTLPCSDDSPPVQFVGNVAISAARTSRLVVVAAVSPVLNLRGVERLATSKHTHLPCVDSLRAAVIGLQPATVEFHTRIIFSCHRRADPLLPRQVSSE